VAKTGPGSDPEDFVGGFFDGELTDTAGWRTLLLIGAGYSSDAAVELGLRPYWEVDVHEAISLLERGCDEATALQILL
jgi:hypothetical protein